ncbi:MAG: hypothetical protein NT038_04950 [Euryarchaeota archaeon]|nr:hypothetical protein [Euryarchaeota archaeon]
MKELTKAQLTVALLAYFATIWEIIIPIFRGTNTDLFLSAGIIVAQLGLLIVLSYAILVLLEWVKVFDLKTNAVLTLFVLITMSTMRILTIAG